MVSRTADWWTKSSLADPEHWREGSGPKFYALLEIDGEPEGYALYRIASKWEQWTPHGEVRVVEALATSPSSTAEALEVPLRHRPRRAGERGHDPAWPLFLMTTDPRRLHLTIVDGLWLRLVDLDAALRARRFPITSPSFEISDDLFPRNAVAGRSEPSPADRTGLRTFRSTFATSPPRISVRSRSSVLPLPAGLEAEAGWSRARPRSSRRRYPRSARKCSERGLPRQTLPLAGRARPGGWRDRPLLRLGHVGGGDRALLASAPARPDACDLRREGDRRRARVFRSR